MNIRISNLIATRLEEGLRVDNRCRLSGRKLDLALVNLTLSGELEKVQMILIDELDDDGCFGPRWNPPF